MIKKNFFTDSIQIIIGNAMSAFAVACFALPYNMVVSGLSGIGRMAEHLWGLGITETVTVFNAVLFILGFWLIGKKFALSTIVGSVSFPVFLEIFQNMTQLHHLVDDPLLAAICAGVIDGVGLGLIIRTGGSTGGIDVPPIILNKKLGLKVAPVMWGIDVGIFLIQLPITPTNGIILGVLYAGLYSIVMNKIIMMNEGGFQAMIFSSHYEEINESLLQQGYGTSIMHLTGGYLRQPQEAILCIATSRQLNRVKRTALDIDPTAFITFSNVSEVNGNGFTTLFMDQEYVNQLEHRRAGEVDPKDKRK